MARQVHGAVCAVDGKKVFTDVTLNGLWTGWSGFADTFDSRHRHQVRELRTEAVLVFFKRCIDRHWGFCAVLRFMRVLVRVACWKTIARAAQP